MHLPNTEVTEATDDTEVTDEEDIDTDDDDNFVIISPMFNYKCTNTGTFAHITDCSKFWLCTQPAGGTALEPKLFKSPTEFLYDDKKRRCVPAEGVVCGTEPDLLARFQLEPQGVQLRVSELDAFFALYNF